MSKSSQTMKYHRDQRADRWLSRGRESKSLALRSSGAAAALHAVVDYPDHYVQTLILKALQHGGQLPWKLIGSVDQLPSPDALVLQFTAYEALDFDHAMDYPETSLVCSYVIRKALIRKHYLSNTVSTWLVKHPESMLATHFKPCVHFELDFAEFLDEALVDAWDLNESLQKNENGEDSSDRDWWILKPGMSDGGNGIRLFSTMDELQAIFEEWEGVEDSEAENDEELTQSVEGTVGAATMTSQLRHFIAQPYIDPPLLLPSYGNRKFHIRTYVVAVGALKVFVYREMLALFAAKPYQPPAATDRETGMDLTHHLTNTCFQDESTRKTSVHRFWALHEPHLASGWQERLFSQICEVTSEIFEAAAKEQMVHFQAIPNAFEIFGVDFLVDANQDAYLLELNSYPDFKQTGADLQDTVVGSLFEEVLQVVVRPFLAQTQGESCSSKLQMVKTIDLGRR